MLGAPIAAGKRPPKIDHGGGLPQGRDSLRLRVCVHARLLGCLVGCLLNFLTDLHSGGLVRPVTGIGRWRPLTSDTLFFCNSLTKGVAACALATLVDRELVRYDDPVIKCWPKWCVASDSPKAHTSIAVAVSHRAGLVDMGFWGLLSICWNLIVYSLQGILRPVVRYVCSHHLIDHS